MPIRIKYGILIMLMVSLLSGCGGGSSGGGTITPNLVNSMTDLTSASLILRSLKSLIRWLELESIASSSDSIGQTTSASITSLQYFIREIELCKDMTIVGTGYSNASGCITLYSTPDTASTATSFYNTYTVTEAIADTSEDHFIDFYTVAGRAKLAKPLTITSSMVGTYHYGKINYNRPIKIKAEFLSPSGSVVAYTKSITASQIVDGGTDSGDRQIEYVRPTTTTTASAELMTYMLNNGGSWFVFLKPFEVTQADIDEKKEIKVDFVFNPIGFANALKYSGANCNSGGTMAVYDPTNCVEFQLPYAQLSPVPRKKGESTRKEIYTVNYSTTPTSSATKVRIEIYYNDADTDKAIRGVGVAAIAQSGATGIVTNVIASTKASEAAGVVSLIGYNSSTQAVDATTLSELVRRKNGTVTIKCYFTGGPCTSSDGTQSFTAYYSYDGDKLVASE